MYLQGHAMICYMLWYDIDKSNIYIFIVAVDDLDSQIKYSQPENCLFISPKKPQDHNGSQREFVTSGDQQCGID
jgi:hypothetical protein